MIGKAGLVGGVVLALLATAFVRLNPGQRVTLNLGLFTLERVSLAVVVLGSIVVGMVVMLGVGLRSDLRVRRILRERLAAEDARERPWLDRNQQDLFEDPSQD